MNWKITEKGWSKELISTLGNRFLIGNGYMGVRGTLEEYKKEQMPAINLAGLYDRVGDGWREPLNAPNGLFAQLKIDDTWYLVPEMENKEHEISLDYRHGIFSRRTVWSTKRGIVTVIGERFADFNHPHLLCMSYSIEADFHADIALLTGIDGDVWDINGPHYDKILFQNVGNYLSAEAVTHECGDTVLVMESCYYDFAGEEKLKEKEKQSFRQISFVTEPNKTYTFEKEIVIYTSKDSVAYKEKAEKELKKAVKTGYDALKREHEKTWEEKWCTKEIEIEGDDEAMEALNYSMYQLECIAPRHEKSMSIPARGLSGQTYKGAVFWDTEMFMLDFFLFTEPEVAKTLMKYRIDTLEGARKKAASYGFDGAFYAWESQEGGYDACSDYNVTDVFTGRPMRTYFKDKQIHISAAVVYGIMRYVEMTGDDTILAEGGAQTVLECARFYESLLVKKVCSEQYELHDVIGPDEYHERVNNNGYTNRMAKFTFESALQVLDYVDRKKLPLPDMNGSEAWQTDRLRMKYQDAIARLYLPKPDTDGVIPQFDGYRSLEDVSVAEVRSRLLHEKEYWGGAYGVASHTQVIKQADVVTWLTLFPKDYDLDVKLKNWNYYEPRTEHGSSLSACMYALLGCKCNMQEKAYPLFLKSAKADLSDGGKEWAGLIYIGGTHPAAAGGAYMTAVEGFGGLTIENQSLRIEPKLPKHWKKLRFHIWFRGELYEVTLTHETTKLEKL